MAEMTSRWARKYLGIRTLAPLLVVCILASGAAFILAQNAGRRPYDSACSLCHGADGTGGQFGSSIVTLVPSRSDEELKRLIRDGLPDRGMPPLANVSDGEINAIIEFLRSMRSLRPAVEPVRRKVQTTEGKALEGVVLNQGPDELQLQTDDKRIHLMRLAGASYRTVTSQSDWPGYDGLPSGNRHSEIDQITRNNVGRLALKWIFTMGTVRVQTTPVVVQGIMYITNANECFALDAGSGREIWHFQRARTPDVVGNAAGGFNRGVAWAGERVFMLTDNAHLIALNRFTGKLLWETEMADYHQNYNGTAAPLIVGDLVVSGIAGGDQGARGFVAAFERETGKEVWRFWTAPKPGEPGSETWKGRAIEHPAAATWMTGTYDPQLGITYWATGNPGPDYNGDEREGDNLYSESVVALDAATGKLKWYYQFTPHDLYDYDAQEPLLLVDANWQGQPRKLMIQGNRNGFFYVLDRTNGKLLLAKPYVKKLTWAKEIDPDGRPVLNPVEKLANGEVKICPAMEGAANWFSTSYNPRLGLFFVPALEKCGVFSKSQSEWQAGRAYMGGSTHQAPGDKAQKILRAIDIQSGNIKWELPQIGPGYDFGGTLSTAGGLVFFGNDSGQFEAVDAAMGKSLWKFPTNQTFRASPMTYVFDGKQYIATASGSTMLAFALAD
jgi:alcohol dehydrogenase (cytochrome c)